MNIVTRTNKKRIIIGIVACIIIIGLVAGGIWLAARKSTNTMISTNGDGQDGWSPKREEYEEFEKLFRENQEDLQKFIEIFWDDDKLKGAEFVIGFDEEWYRKRFSRNAKERWPGILFDNGSFVLDENGEITAALNENDELADALNCISEKGVIDKICQYYSKETRLVMFYVDTQFTPYITTNNGVKNAFVYCENQDYEKYDRNVGDNWYLRITPPPE